MMKKLSMFLFQDNWIEKKLAQSKDSKEELNLKKTFFLSIAQGMPILFVSVIALHIWELRIVALYMSLFALFELLLLFTFIWVRKRTILFALINQSFFVLFSFIATLAFGGILKSGGVVLIGLVGVINSIIFLKPMQIRLLLVAYMILVLTAVILDPRLNPLPEITYRVNLIFFALHLLVIAASLLVMLSIYFNQSFRLKKMETEHLRELDKIKTSFFTNITHEFRTPLTVILGLSDNKLPSTKDNVVQKLRLIHQNGNRLLQLITRILDLSKLESKAMTLNPVRADLISFIRGFTESFMHLAEEKKIEFIFQTEEDSLVMDFDPEKIESLVGNLLMNSFKFSGNGDQILLKILLKKVDSSKIQDGYSPLPEKVISSPYVVHIQVADEGPGIHSDDLHYIFNRFYQGDKLNRKKYGSGIGLLLVKELVALMEGNLYVKSIPEKRTEFSVLLPVANKSTAVMTAVAVSKSQQSEKLLVNKVKQSDNSLILMVEDNDDLVYFLYSVLQSNFNLERASNGLEGREKALLIMPDLVVSDIMMPEMDGYELCNFLKNDYRTSHIPILLLTAKADVESRVSGYKAGADAYLPKPFEAIELNSIIYSLLNNREKLKAKYKSLATLPENVNIEASNPDETFLLKLREVMDSNYQEDQFGSNQLVSEMGMSRTQLFRKLKMLTGLSASHYIRLYRLKLAKYKIEKTALTISEIAYECGFSDPAYFSHAFNKEFGLSPSKARSKQQEFET